VILKKQLTIDNVVIVCSAKTQFYLFGYNFLPNQSGRISFNSICSN